MTNRDKSIACAKHAGIEPSEVKRWPVCMDEGGEYYGKNCFSTLCDKWFELRDKCGKNQVIVKYPTGTALVEKLKAWIRTRPEDEIYRLAKALYVVLDDREGHSIFGLDVTWLIIKDEDVIRAFYAAFCKGEGE